MTGKKTGAILLCILFGVVTTSLAVSLGIYKVFGSADSIKDITRASGLYDSVKISDLLTDEQTQLSGRLPLDNTTIQKILDDTFTPSNLEKNGDSAIDNFYSWLEGKSASPNLSINLSDQKDALAMNAGKAIAEKASALPACRSVQSVLTARSDPLAATCRPPGLSSAMITDLATVAAQQRLDQITSAQPASNTIALDQNNDVSKSLSVAPDAYQFLQILPWMLGGLALLLGAGIIGLAGSRSGIKMLGITSIVSGATVLLGSWLFAFALTELARRLFSSSEIAGLVSVAPKLANLVVEALQATVVPLGLILGGVGIALVVGAHFVHKKLRSSEVHSKTI